MSTKTVDNWDKLDKMEREDHYGGNVWKPQKSKAACYASHPTLEILNGEVLGGSCIRPALGYDIYIGFDYGMRFVGKAFPWEEQTDKTIEFLYEIKDMNAPDDPASFKKMIEWIILQLDAGKKIHMGCIGGHGRTGTVLSALIRQVCDVEDSTTWVRENYCKKAVESKSQVEFLYKHFGVKRTSSSKGSYSNNPSVLTKMNSSSRRGAEEIIPHIESKFCIW